MLQVDDLDLARSFAPAMRESITSTNVFVHVEATRAAAGLGLLLCFMADRHDDLVGVLEGDVALQLTYWWPGPRPCAAARWPCSSARSGPRWRISRRYFWASGERICCATSPQLVQSGHAILGNR